MFCWALEASSSPCSRPFSWTVSRALWAASWATCWPRSSASWPVSFAFALTSSATGPSLRSSTREAGISRPAMKPTAMEPIARPSGFSCAMPAARRALSLTCSPSGCGVADADDLRLDRVLRAHEALLRARLHVGLVGEGVDGLAHLVAGRLYFLADPVWVFAHWMSSFTVSTVCSGTGGVACCSSLRPRAASTRADDAPTGPSRSARPATAAWRCRARRSGPR